MVKDYSAFLETLFEKLHGVGVDLSELALDHLGYQCSSGDDYKQRDAALSKLSDKLSEELVGGRRVGIYRLHSPFRYKDTEIFTVELVEPKEGQEVQSAWEHAEFTVAGTLEAFMNKYPDLNWETRALQREEFPMLILPLGDGVSAKFPRRGVLEEAARLDQGK